MRYLVDECLGQSIVVGLREQGHDLAWVREVAKGMPDESVLAWSDREDRILVTEDFDYGELVFAKGHPAFGVVILRLASFQAPWDEVAPRIIDRLKELQESLPGNLTVIGRTRIKPRALPSR